MSIPENRRPFDYGSRTETFADLAGVMANLDVVVSVDTAPLHLAGALGVKTYGLIQRSPDWRWGLAGERTMWYDSVTLLRQERLFDWDSCVARLESLLREDAGLRAC